MANLIIVATGVKPNTEFLKDTGIELFKNGAIIINRFGETNILMFMQQEIVQLYIIQF